MIYNTNNNLYTFSKNKEEGGFCSNMYPASIEYRGRKWKHSEGLFQSMRFNDVEIITLINRESNPMKSKRIAYEYMDKFVVKPYSDNDIANMQLCISLKFTQNLDLKEKLLATEDKIIIEDVTKRLGGSSIFWGMANVVEDLWIGENKLGDLLMDFRDQMNTLFEF